MHNKEVWRAHCFGHGVSCPVDLDPDWAYQGWGYLPAAALVRYVEWRREHAGCNVSLVMDTDGASDTPASDAAP